MSHANGKIYADSNYGVSIEDVRTVLLEASTDLGTLCTSSLINKWSKVKPVRHSSLSALANTQFATLNYGFATGASPAELVGETPADALNLMLNGTAYSYLVPRGGAVSPVEPYRLTDFNGYNHNAPVPYAEFHSIKELSLPYFTLTKDANAEITLSDFSGIVDYENLGSWKVILIYRLHSATGAASVAYPVESGIEGAVTTLSGLDSGGAVYFRSSAALSSSLYDYCFAIYEANDDVYIPLPLSGTFTPSAYSPFSLYLPFGTPRYETFSNDGITITGIRIPMVAEYQEASFDIYVDFFLKNDELYERVNDSVAQEERITITPEMSGEETYAYSGLWDDLSTSPAADFVSLNVPVSDIDKLYFIVRIHNSGDNRWSYFVPGIGQYEPGTFQTTQPNYTKLVQ